MTRPSKSRAIAIANPNLSRDQLAAIRKRERKAEEDRQRALSRFDDAVRESTATHDERSSFPGGEPWHWAPRGRQAVMCKGFPIPVGKESKRMVRHLSEDGAQRAILAAALDAVGGDVRQLPLDQLAAALALSDGQQRKIKRELRGRAK